ncbi:MAG: hypothetical protein CM1200mP1_12730 [Candidatus Neomarinimicrobiota bacterium]|nr:MAG: hypothetical protein CM1200mP1_12730 [Candidatus Neomarinimicrobiota bacterium]
MQKSPLWTDQFSRPNNIITSDSPSAEIDIAIVGSGYTGLCAARILKKNGASVTVLDRNTIGWGASSSQWWHGHTWFKTRDTKNP